MNTIDEKFLIDDSSGGLTTLSRLNDSYREVAQRLLNHYVRLQVRVLSRVAVAAVKLNAYFVEIFTSNHQWPVL